MSKMETGASDWTLLYLDTSHIFKILVLCKAPANFGTVWRQGHFIELTPVAHSIELHNKVSRFSILGILALTFLLVSHYFFVFLIKYLKTKENGTVCLKFTVYLHVCSQLLLEAAKGLIQWCSRLIHMGHCR